LVENKIDLAPENPASRDTLPKVSPETNEYLFTCTISASNGAGVDALIAALTTYANEYFAAAESGIVTRARHRQALEEAVAAIDRALTRGTKASGHEELIAEELHAAATTLGRLTGRVDVEDILDVIFRDFCIGK
jgi:tRNA modification GTPase